MHQGCQVRNWWKGRKDLAVIAPVPAVTPHHRLLCISSWCLGGYSLACALPPVTALTGCKPFTFCRRLPGHLASVPDVPGDVETADSKGQKAQLTCSDRCRKAACRAGKREEARQQRLARWQSVLPTTQRGLRRSVERRWPSGWPRRFGASESAQASPQIRRQSRSQE